MVTLFLLIVQTPFLTNILIIYTYVSIISEEKATENLLSAVRCQYLKLYNNFRAALYFEIFMVLLYTASLQCMKNRYALSMRIFIYVKIQWINFPFLPSFD